MVTDVVQETLAGGLTEIRMSDGVLDATLALGRFCSRRSTRTRWRRRSSPRPRASSGASGRRSRARPEDFLDLRTVEAEGVDVAAQDFVAGMTDRYAVSLFERLFIPKPWVGPSVVY